VLGETCDEDREGVPVNLGNQQYMGVSPWWVTKRQSDGMDRDGGRGY
jgi:hypothetical protein